MTAPLAEMQSSVLVCTTIEVYCPVCEEYIEAELLESATGNNIIFYHNENPHDEQDYEALDYGIN